MPRTYKDITGQKYGNLTAISFSHIEHKGARWLCSCDCGNTKVVGAGQLQSGNTKSCGCLKTKATVDRNTTHGMSHLPEYSHWKGMLKRCFNENDKRFDSYAGRGISVHTDFIKDFPAWLSEIGEKPKDGQRWSVGRKDNDGWYTYSNMEWQLDPEQSRNHSMQSNNTSGITGIQRQVKNIAGTDYESFVACWNDETGKKRTKNFSTNKFGYEGAKQLAIEYRNKMIANLEKLGIIYAESHGSAK